MSSANKIKAVVLSCDRNRAITEHMIVQYERLWPEHPFIFLVPYQQSRQPDSDRMIFVHTAVDIPNTVLELIAGLDDEELVYWCSDDKYPIRLVTERIASLMRYAQQSPEVSGLMFCRCRATLERPELALYPGERTTPDNDVLLERTGWYQFWIHQFLRVKVLRYFFSELPDQIPSAKSLDAIKKNILKLADHRLFVTKENFAIFGESTKRGRITQNCYQSIGTTNIELPEWFRRPNGEYVTLGKL